MLDSLPLPPGLLPQQEPGDSPFSLPSSEPGYSAVAPHIAEELWSRLGHPESVTYAPFPQVSDTSLLVEDTVTCVVQVAGKVRDRLEVSPTISDADLEAAALAAPGVERTLEGRGVRKVIVRAPRLVNIVPA